MAKKITTKKAPRLADAVDDGEVSQNSPIVKLVQELFKDAKVNFKRKNSRGHGYSIIDDAIDVFLGWDNMPWER